MVTMGGIWVSDVVGQMGWGMIKQPVNIAINKKNSYLIKYWSIGIKFFTQRLPRG